MKNVKADDIMLRDLVLDINNPRFAELYGGSKKEEDLIEYLLYTESGEEIVNGIVGSPKNNKERRIPLTDDVLAILIDKKPLKDEYVFLDKIVSRFALNRALKRACKPIGVDIGGWHDLRHTFASKLANNGISLQVIQVLLGHSDLKMTQRYAHLEPVTLSEAINTLSPSKEVSENCGHNMDTNSKFVKDLILSSSLKNGNFALKINKNRY